MISFVLFCEDYNQDFVMAPSKTLGLHNSLDTLPSKKPYGFWVNKWGHWIDVNTFGHANSASEIINNYKAWAPINRKSIENINNGAYTTLWQHGFIRLASEIDIEGKDVFYWEHPSKKFVPTQSQQKFIKAIEQLYYLPVRRDKDGATHH